MKIYIGSDHAGLELKNEIGVYLNDQGIEVVDCGTYSSESCDYPDFAKKVCRGALLEQTYGILVCSTGIGMSIVANKFKGIRAALVGSVEDSQLTREHNDANVLCLGAKNTSIDLAKKIVDTFLNTAFSGDRHLRRVNKIKAIEDEER